MKKKTMPLMAMIALSLGLVTGCGDNLAPFDAVVTGPADSAVTINPPGGGDFIFQALDFKVANGNGIPLPKTEVELLAGSFDGSGRLTDLSGNPLNASNPTYFKTETDDRGLARTSFLISLPDCDPDADLTVTGSVNASVGVTSKLWTATFTVKQC